LLKEEAEERIKRVVHEKFKISLVKRTKAWACLGKRERSKGDGDGLLLPRCLILNENLSEGGKGGGGGGILGEKGRKEKTSHNNGEKKAPAR